MTLYQLGPSEANQSQERPSPPSFPALLKELCRKVSAEWEEIGIFLHIEDGILQAIECDNPNNSRKCFNKMLRHWLKQVNPPPTWSAIIDAIDTLGHESLALDLTEKYVK